MMTLPRVGLSSFLHIYTILEVPVFSQRGSRDLSLTALRELAI